VSVILFVPLAREGNAPRSTMTNNKFKVVNLLIDKKDGFGSESNLIPNHSEMPPF